MKTIGRVVLSLLFSALFLITVCAALPEEEPQENCPHEQTEETVVTAPTCTEEGETVLTCTACGAVFSVKTEPLGHDFITETTPATCTEDGEIVSVCSRCGETVKEPIPALGHDFKTETKPATCTKDGETVSVCSRCGDTVKEPIPALGHDFKTETKPATCTKDGETVSVCSRCGKTVKEPIPAPGHSYGAWKTVVSATWRASGKEECACAACGNKKTRTVAKLTHLTAKKCPAGDADMDGRVTSGDARLILRLSVGFDDGLDADQHRKADFDGKDGVTPADARCALRVSVGLSAVEPQLAKGFTFKGYTKKKYVLAEKDGATYVVTPYGYTLIANKTYSLPASYAPGDLTAECSAAFREMQKGAARSGIDLYIVSGYRSYYLQQSIYSRYCARDGRAEADTYSARPGHSEHQSGLAMDLNSLYASFAYTAEGRWLAANAYKYGFIIRYPKGKQSVTGYVYEPWHVRYLGKELAADVYSSGLCLEEYFGITSSYS